MAANQRSRARRGDGTVPGGAGLAPGRPREVWRSRARTGTAIALLTLATIGIGLLKAFQFAHLSGDLLLEIYGLVAGSYMATRFALAFVYRPPGDNRLEPRVAIVMPAFNERDAIAGSLRSLLALEYPPDKLAIVAVNDGSTDDTLAELERVARDADGRLRVIDFPINRGKRAAMAAGIKATDAEIIAFVDSDSVLLPDALYKLVQPFSDPRIGAVCGHARVFNVHESWLAKMQAVRYYMGFTIIKAAESLFGAVTCCSGCFAAYRREAIVPHLSWWQEQRFLGRPASIGDDRSLTNCVLRKWRVVFHAGAVSQTIVPETFKRYAKQQTRWKRSWTRESLIVGRFIWRKHPAAAAAAYISILMPLLAPLSAIRVVMFHLVRGPDRLPLIYAAGVVSMALVCCLYFAARARGSFSVWIHGMAFVIVNTGFMMWLTYYAILTCRSDSWCTRPARRGAAHHAGRASAYALRLARAAIGATSCMVALTAFSSAAAGSSGLIMCRRRLGSSP